MILADTNIMVEYFRSRDSELARQVDAMPLALCGAVRAEILHGSRSDQETDEMLDAFKTFDSLPTDEYDWEGVGFVLQTLRTHGIQVPFADAIIAFTAMKYDAALWTRDAHFKHVQAYYPELRLYEESA